MSIKLLVRFKALYLKATFRWLAYAKNDETAGRVGEGATYLGYAVRRLKAVLEVVPIALRQPFSAQSGYSLIAPSRQRIGNDMLRHTCKNSIFRLPAAP